MGSFSINEFDSHKIIREWLILYIYAEFPVSESAIDGLAGNLISSLKKGRVVSANTTDIVNDDSSI